MQAASYTNTPGMTSASRKPEPNAALDNQPAATDGSHHANLIRARMPARRYAADVAAQALAHIFLGLMKADGVITPAEEAQMLAIQQDYKDELPCNFTAILANIDLLRADPAIQAWVPDQHLHRGLQRLDAFIEHSSLSRSYVTSLMEMLDSVMEQDGIDAKEAAYLREVERELTTRFLRLID